MRIADRVVLMRKGRIVQSGPPEELYRKPVDLEAARFFCDVNEIACAIVDGQAQSAIGHFPAEGLANGPGSLCIRPQGIKLLPPGEGIAGRVQSSRFLGEMILLDLNVQGLERPIQARVREFSVVSRSRDVGITIDFDEVLVFSHEHA